jgi:glucan phosphoethanolaminetransferase (alkaline phosphatase superfamily)
MEKPKIIERVNFLLGISLTINIVFGVFNLCIDAQYPDFSGITILIFVIAIIIKAFWYFKIYQGSNIARTLYIWIGAFALPIIFIASFFVMYDKSFFDGLEHLILSVIGLIIIFSLCNPEVKSWFEQVKSEDK